MKPGLGAGSASAYVVPKKTGSHADVLAAAGAADLLRHLDPRIIELRDRYEIRLLRELRRSDVDAVEPGFCFLVRRGKKTPHQLPPERVVTATDDRMYAILDRMRAYGGPNKVVSRFVAMKRSGWEARVWDSLHGRKDFVFTSPLVQLFNPESATGYSLLKPSGTNRKDRTRNQWAEPFQEWLRFRGYFETAAGWFTDGDLRLYCPIPSDIGYSQLASVSSAFRHLRLGGTSVKLDCRAILGLTRLLIEQSPEGGRPVQRVRAVCVTHYKDMGRAHTLMRMAQLALPGWANAESLPTLEEHETALRRLNDSRCDELDLLKRYRFSFTSHAPDCAGRFVEFLAGYNELLFRRRAQAEWLLPQFSPVGAAPVLTSDPALVKAMSNPGFIAVAAAVRSSTFSAQIARRNGSPQSREVRYGLLSDLRRGGILGKTALSKTVGAFVSQFNRESFRLRSAGVPAAHVREHEIDAFQEWLGRMPSSFIAASLLCGIAGVLRESKSREVRAEIIKATREPETATAHAGPS